MNNDGCEKGQESEGEKEKDIWEEGTIGSQNS